MFVNAKKVSLILPYVKNGVAVIVLAFGALLRFYYLGYRGFWSDEAVPIRYWTGTLAEVLSKVSKDLHPPLWFITVNLTSRLGNTDFIIRLPSAIAGVLSLVILYWLGKSMFNWKVGIIAALLLSLNSFHIYHSQEARLYSLFGFFSITSVWLLWNAIQKRLITWWLAYAIVISLDLYTHYNSLFVIGSQAFFVVVLFLGNTFLSNNEPKEHLNKQLLLFTGSLLFAAIIFLPWCINLFHDIPRLLAGEGVSWGSVPRNWNSIKTYLENQLLYIFAGYDASMIVPYLVVFILGVIAALIKKQFAQLLLACSILLLPIIIVVLVLQKGAHPRYFFYGLPMFVLLAARGFEGIYEFFSCLLGKIAKSFIRPTFALSWINAKVILSTLIILGSMGWFLNKNVNQIHRYYERDIIGSWREIASFIQNNNPTDDIILTERAIPFSRYISNNVSWHILAGDWGNYSLEKAQADYLEGKNVWVIMPMNYWNISTDTRDKTIKWATDVPHVTINFGGWAFPHATVYYLSPHKTQEQLLLWFSRNAYISNQPEVDLSLAQDYRNAGLVNESADEYNRVLKFGSTRPFVPGHISSNSMETIYREMGDMYFDNNRLHDASNAYELALTINKQDTSILIDLSSLYQKLNRKAIAAKYRNMANDIFARQGLGKYLEISPLVSSYHHSQTNSNNNILAMYQVGQAKNTYDVSPGVYTIQVKAGGDQGCGAWPVLNVYVDSIFVGSEVVSSRSIKIYEFQEVTFKNKKAGIAIEFSQPMVCNVSGQDINLYVQGIYLKYIRKAPPAPSVVELDLQKIAASYHEGKSYQDGVLQMFWEGRASIYKKIKPGDYTVKINAWGQQGCGIWPQLRLNVDGKDAGKVTVTGLNTYEFSGVQIRSNKKNLIIIDYIQPGTCNQAQQDVNLFIKRIVFEQSFGM